ncbi:cytochrome-c peroxidase [Photobacterium lutimaris]|uniref:Methylamine utilization protein n=1 Tax=Photobacterium lutimaris TaxID=388278 RepID=A0A2T3IK88_9GAMM|nr:cytochrome c peroxidase [Photobacterium lutimaris]PSU28734.1 methylamine utilization protein [Photobacterium lutimaris]TDR70243.1 cytochrome c peroxidase [Photobacterium lutimaris]
MNPSRYLLAAVLIAAVTACREDSDDLGSLDASSVGVEEAEVVQEPAEAPAEEQPDGVPPVTPPTDGDDAPVSEPPPPPPEAKLDIDGLPLPDLSADHDYEAYLMAQPKYYTRITSPFGNVDSQNNTPFGNKVTNAGANLGRVIFYDVRLSANNTVACASCHLQKHGFTDPKKFSDGFDGGKTGRHSMSLSNAAYYRNGKFFWDERADTLEDQVLMPIQDAVEMGMNLFDLEVKMAETSFYAELFTEAFGDEAITSERISRALAQFIRTMISYESKYDQAFTAGEWDEPDFAAVFSEQEMLGLRLFSGFPGTERDSLGCIACHQTSAHSMDQAHVNGLDADTRGDQGAGNGFFKSPSLRNIGVGAPYMHDGRFETLMDVVEFYNSGVQRHRILSPDLTSNGQTGGNPIRMNLTQEEKEALVAFLEALTDETFLMNPIYHDPFFPNTVEGQLQAIIDKVTEQQSEQEESDQQADNGDISP